MVRTNCSLYGCLSSSKHNKNLTFHRFPRDARCHLWINACQRPELRDKTSDQLKNMHICGLHFERWMYSKHKLKSSAIPVLNLPSASIHSIGTQTEVSEIEITKDSETRAVQHQTDNTTKSVSAVASSSKAVAVHSTSTQTTTYLTEHNPRKRRKQEIKKFAKKSKLMEGVSRQQFLQGCDKFLSPNLSKIVKAQFNL